MQYKKWFTFWKKNLSDTLKPDIDIKKLNYFEIDGFDMKNNVINQSEKINKLIDIEELQRNKRKGIKSRRDENWISVDGMHVLIAPIKIKPKDENLPYLNDTNEKFPFWYFAKIDREGKLYLPDETLPVFPRKFLKPLADGFIFGTLESTDKIKGAKRKEFLNYGDYIQYLNTLFKQAIGQEVCNYNISGYEVINNGLVLLPRKDILLLLESLNFIKNY